jgi:phosphoribosylamine---glycine ligase
MRILFITQDFIAADLARILKNEGHDVRLYIEEKARRNNFKGIVFKSLNWQNDLGWVGKSGLIIFDDTGYGKIQDDLRKDGYTVFGGSEMGERLEQDREFGHKTFQDHGLKTAVLRDFDKLQDAINFVKKNKGAWAIKTNAHHYTKASNYISELYDGSDAIDILENFKTITGLKDLKITLQEKIKGVEIGVGRYFNGHDWVGPIEYNVVYSRFFPGDIGPITSEMGTLAWYSNDETAPLYREVLSKLKPFLQKSDFRGDFEIDCIVNETGAYPLEATARLGSPIVHLQAELHKSPWGEFLNAVASGKSYNLKWKQGYGIVVTGVVPPFPNGDHSHESVLKGAKIYLKDCSKADLNHLHFEEVSMKDGNYYISDSRGFILYATSVGKDIPTAQRKAYELLKKIYVPKLFYRNDIGNNFLLNFKKLQKWGYISMAHL